MKFASIAILTMLAIGTAHAQNAKDFVRRAVEAAVEGKCSEVLSTMVKAICEQQMPQAAPTYKALGKVQDLTFKGYETTPNGKAEVYLADHANGKMMWMAIKGPDDKLSVFWSPGPMPK